jgi:hypothetical protein
LFLGACMGSDGGLMLLSEFVDDGSLEDYVARRSAELRRPWRPAAERVLRWGQDLAQAVCFLHGCDPVVIHRCREYIYIYI